MSPVIKFSFSLNFVIASNMADVITSSYYPYYHYYIYLLTFIHLFIIICFLLLLFIYSATDQDVALTIIYEYYLFISSFIIYLFIFLVFLLVFVSVFFYPRAIWSWLIKNFLTSCLPTYDFLLKKLIMSIIVIIYQSS